MTNDNGKLIAKALMERFDPELAPATDELWNDYEQGDQADKVEPVEHGAGIPPDVTVWSLIIIPLVQAIVKKTVDVSVDSLREWLKARNERLTELEAQALANATVDELLLAEKISSLN